MPVKTVSLLTYFLIAFAFFCAYFTPVDGKEFFAVVPLGIVLLGMIWVRVWPAIYLSLTFFIFSLYFVLEPKWLATIPVHAPLFSVLFSSFIVYLAQPSVIAWNRFGKIDAKTWMQMILSSICAVASLLIWAQWSDSLGHVASMIQSLKTAPFWLVALVLIPLFSLLMSLAEEILYRGIMLDTVEELTGSAITAQVVQAATYGAFHYAKAFPNGSVGFVMVFAFGILLGYLRRRTKGLLAPYLVHVAADLTIGYFLIFKFL